MCCFSTVNCVLLLDDFASKVLSDLRDQETRIENGVVICSRVVVFIQRFPSRTALVIFSPVTRTASLVRATVSRIVLCDQELSACFRRQILTTNPTLRFVAVVRSTQSPFPGHGCSFCASRFLKPDAGLVGHVSRSRLVILQNGNSVQARDN